MQSGSWGRVGALNSAWLSDSPSGNYADSADWAIRNTGKVDVGARSDCVLRFRYGTFLQAGADWLSIQSSTDATTWADVGRIGDTNGAVRQAFYALGTAGSRYYRFRLTSDATTNSDGVYIDNVRIACPGGAYGSGDYKYLNGTSMAAPPVAGAAAALFSGTPAPTVAEAKTALINSGDAVARLTGKTASGRRLNLDAALRSLVGKANTTTTITAHDPDPAVAGQAVTVRYKVTGNVPGGGAPSGNVTVTDGSRSCTGTVDAGLCAITFTTAGPKSLTATYAGDDLYGASPASAVVSHQVNRADTTATITSNSPDPSDLGQSVSVDFAVAPVAPGSGTPTGDVTIGDGVDSCTATVGTGRCAISLTTTGTRTLTATYAGDANFNSSNSPAEPHTVQQPNSPGGPPPTRNPPSTTGGQPPAANPPSSPLAHLSGASQTNPKFRISAKKQLARISRRRALVGTTFTYTLDAAATVRLEFTQPGRGRTVNGKCVSVKKRNRGKPRCALDRGLLTFAGHAGLNTVRFTGWLSRTRKLTPGSYTLRIAAITPGVGATTQRLYFRVVR